MLITDVFKEDNLYGSFSSPTIATHLSFFFLVFFMSGMPITDVFKEDIGIGGVISLLWYVHFDLFVLKLYEMLSVFDSLRLSSLFSI